MLFYLSFMVLGCHVSALLPEEWKNADPRIVEEVMQAWQGVPVSIEIKKCYIYKLHGWKTVFALNVHSDDILDAREDLGFFRNPKKYNMHVSLLEKW